MDFWIWIALPLVVALGSALLTYGLMREQTVAALAQEKALTRQAEALLRAQTEAAEDRVRSATEAARNVGMERVLGDLRVEERRFARNNAVVVQERLLYRNLPLSNWIEHEMAAAAGSGTEQPVLRPTVFPVAAATPALPEATRLIEATPAT